MLHTPPPPPLSLSVRQRAWRGGTFECPRREPAVASHPHYLVVTPTEERRLVEEDGPLSKKTWLQKIKEDDEERASSCDGPLSSFSW